MMEIVVYILILAYIGGCLWFAMWLFDKDVYRWITWGDMLTREWYVLQEEKKR